MASYLKRKVKCGHVWDVRFRIREYGREINKSLNGFPGKTEARLAYEAFITSYKPSEKPASLMTFADLYHNYKLYIAGRLKESSRISIEKATDKHIIPYLGKMKIANITKKEIIEWQNKINTLNLSYNYKSKLLGHITAIFNYGIDYGDVTVNPASRAKGFRDTDGKKDMLFWAEDEFKQFISCVDNIIDKTFFSFLYLTGARRGEALALTWNDIKGNVVAINKSCCFHAKDKAYAITSPKNKSSNRQIFLPETLIKQMSEYKQHCETLEGYTKNSFVFCNDRPIPPETIRKRLIRYCQKAQVKQIRVHDFRHSHASLLINKGQNILAVAARLGHSDIEQTLNTYSHFFDSEQKKLTEVINIDL